MRFFDCNKDEDIPRFLIDVIKVDMEDEDF